MPRSAFLDSRQRRRQPCRIEETGRGEGSVPLAFILAACVGTSASEDECPSTLEDLYGETGNSFQAAMGFVSFEGTSSDPATQSYGMGLDDMYVEWRELARGPDTTSCVTGQCAALELTQSTLFDSEAVVAISLLDSTPWGFACSGGDRLGEVCYPSGIPVGFGCGEGSCESGGERLRSRRPVRRLGR